MKQSLLFFFTNRFYQFSKQLNPKTKSFSKIVPFVLLICCLSENTFAQYGALDCSFGNNGLAALNLSATSNTAQAIAVFDNGTSMDGKIVVAGNYYDGANSQFGVAIFNEDGTPYTAFNGTGWNWTSFNPGYKSQPYGIAIQSDDKIVVAGIGHTQNGGMINTDQLAMARFNTNGTLDATFGSSGNVFISLGPTNNRNDEIYDMVIDASDNIYVAGGKWTNASTFQRASVIYKTDSNGNNGQQFVFDVIPTSSDSGSPLIDEAFYGLTIHGGNIYAAGYYEMTENGDKAWLVAKMSTSGVKDNSFGTNGIATINPTGGQGDWAYDVGVQSDGTVVVMGEANNDFAVVKLNSTGVVQNTYTFEINGTDDCKGGLVLSDDKILLYGNNNSNLAFLRLNADATLDNTFGSSGEKIVDHESRTDYVYDAAIQSDGKIVSAGSWSNPEGTTEFAVTRLIGDDLAMSYCCGEAVQQTGEILKGDDGEILKIKICAPGNLNPENVTQMNFTTVGSTNATTDLAAAKLYFTGTSDVYSQTTQFGGTVSSPNGSFAFNGAQELSSGTNYFWLVYTTKSTATSTNVVDAVCTNYTITSGTFIPSDNDPTGSRSIVDPHYPYVTPVDPLFNLYNWITNVTFGTINNSTGKSTDANDNADAYTDYSATQSTTVNGESTYNMSVTIQVPDAYGEYVRAYFDWNSDYDFTDDGEEIIIASDNATSGAVTVNRDIIIPADASGAIRLRITCDDNAQYGGSVTGGNIDFGEAEDYTINVVGSSTAPTVTTQAVSSITTTTATGNGNITDLGGANITERGIYYSTTDGFADGAGTKVSTTGNWSTTGSFTQAITGLSHSTVYFVKAFATNSEGTGYGSQVSFTTSTPDVTPPSASSITLSGSPAANATSVSFVVTFSESVTGVDASDFSVDGSGVTGSITGLTGSGSSYTVTVGSVSGTGTISIDLKATGTGITDAAGNTISGGFTTGATHTVDADAPSVSSISISGSPATNATSVSFAVAFSESVSGVDASDFSVDGSGVAGNITGITGSGSSYTVTVGSVSGTGTLSIDLNASGTGITDGAGNAIGSDFTAGATHTVDTDAPAVSSILISGSPAANATSVSFAVTFSESVSGVDASDFSVDGSGVTGNITGITGSGSSYTVTVGSVSGTGTLSVDLNSSGTGITDGAGNAIGSGFMAGATHTVDTDAPAVSSISVSGSPAANATSVSFVVTFSESVSGVDASDFSVDGSGVTGNITGITGSGTGYTATVGSISGTGTLSVDLNSSGTGIADATGNAISGGFTAGSMHTVDTEAPNVSSIVRQSPATSPTNADALVWDVTFNEAVSNVGTADFSVSGTTATVTGVTNPSGNTYRVTVSGGDLASLNGTVTLSFAVGQDITDAGGNALSNTTPTGTNNNTFLEDNTAPITSPFDPADNFTDIALNSNLVMTFSENIYVGSGNIVIRKISDNSAVQTIAVTDNSQVSVSTVTVTINPANDLALNTSYYIQIANMAFTDLSGNNYAGINDNSTWNFTTVDQTEMSVNDPSVAEGNSGTTTLIYTVSLSQGAPAGGATVDYATSDGTATVVSDYTAASGTLSFSQGETSKTVDIIVSGDNVLEANETITFTLSNESGTNIVISDATGTGTINNDDAAAVTIENVSGNEDDGAITLTATLDHLVQGGFTVDVSTADGTATTADGDYSAVSSHTLIFLGNILNETQTFTVTPTSDTKLEANETVSISQSNLAATALSVDISDGATVTVNNDDVAAVTIEDADGYEDSGAITMTATLDHAVQGGFTVDVSTADGTATLADGDYSAVTSQTLIFIGNKDEEQTFTVTPTSDAKVETDETFIISQSNLAATALAVNISDTAIVTINNDDLPAEVTNVSSTTPDDFFIIGDTIPITILFSRKVLVTGFPQLKLETGIVDTTAGYFSGSDTTLLTFNYIVQKGNESPDLDYTGINSFILNGGTIKDSAGNDATLTLPTPGAAGSLSSNKAIVIDGILPVVLTKDIDVYLDASGLVSIVPENIDNGSSDNFGIGTLYLDKYDFDCENLGINKVVLTAEDIHGNLDTASASVTIFDTISPVAAAQNITVYLDINGEVEITANQINDGSFDNCAIDTLFLDKYYFDCDNTGENTLTITAVDKSGNTNSDSTTITVLDTIKPSIQAPGIIGLILNENGEATITPAQISNYLYEACEIDSVYLNVYEFGCNDLGAHEVTITAVDKSGNTAIATTTVVVMDTVAPVAMAQDITVYLDETGNVSVGADQVDNGSYDACTNRKLYLDKYNFTCADLGTNAVIFTVKDISGNSADTVIYITVKDELPPLVDSIANVEMELPSGVCETAITYPELIVNDACETKAERVSGLGPDGTFPVGVTTETWEVSDTSGNITTVSFDVVITGTNTAPTIGTTADTTVYEDAGTIEIPLSGISYGTNDCNPQEVNITASADNPGLFAAIQVDYTDGATGSLALQLAPDMNGTAEVVVLATDSEGAETADTFMVTVVPVNDPPFVVMTIPDQVVYIAEPAKIPVSPVMGVLFDDVDDNSLNIETMVEGTDILPSWIIFTADTLYASPTEEDLGCYNIVLSATDTSGASVTDTFEICVEDVNVGVGDISTDELNVKMYPNPSKRLVTLDINSNGYHDVELSVMDISGKLVLQQKYAASQTISFDMSDKVSGIYLVHIKLDDQYLVKKLILDRK